MHGRGRGRGWEELQGGGRGAISDLCPGRGCSDRLRVASVTVTAKAATQHARGLSRALGVRLLERKPLGFSTRTFLKQGHSL